MTRLTALIGTMDCDHCLAVAWLENKGWKRTADNRFQPPFYSYDPTSDERLVLDHLMKEWNFNGIDDGPYYKEGHRLVRNGVPTRVAPWVADLSDEAQDMMLRPTYQYAGPFWQKKFGPRA